MAYFAELDENNNVVDIVFMDNIQTMTNEGEEDETVGIARLPIRGDGHRWLRFSWNTRGGVHSRGKEPFRYNTPRIGWIYDEDRDMYRESGAKDWFGNDCPNHTLNETTGLWDAPLPEPELTSEQVGLGGTYYWDQSAYEADNTTGWIYLQPEHE